MLPETERIALPSLPPAPPRPPFPYLAALAPVVIAVVLWAVTSSPYVLMFAFLGPVLAVASTLDGRRVARRTRREALADALERLTALQERLDRRARRWRDDVATQFPALADGCASDAPATPGVWRLGWADVPSGVELDGDTGAEPEYAQAVAQLGEHAAMIPNAPVLVASDDIHLSGPSALVAALARALVLQAALAYPPQSARVTVPHGERWADALPHRVEYAEGWEVRGEAGSLLVVRTGEARAHGARVGVQFSDTGDEARVRTPSILTGYRAGLVSRREAAVRARQIAERARRLGWDDEALLPDVVMLDSLWAAPNDVAGDAAGYAAARGSAGSPLAVAVGMLTDRPVIVDLDQDGPHALVAGTTGSGKSELLISWVLALAYRTPPEQLTFLLIDFKGGAAFSPLLDLPHVVGVVSDLDPTTARRAIDSLRAELRRREHLLAAHGVRDITELPQGALPRLVVVVDELAALLALDPDLGAVFSDLAARGRSLGLHLILCTQRPSGIVREGILANITLRICLRVLDPADSDAVVGTRAAAGLPASARGRAIVSERGVARIAQVALAAPDAAARIAERWAGHHVPEARPWLDPLPAHIPLDALPADDGAGGLAVGVVDVPSEQAQRVLRLDPWADGAVLVVGASGSGRTTALHLLAHAASADGSGIRWVSDDPAELWQALTMSTERRRVLVIADDLDRTFALVDAEQRTDLAELIRRVARDARRSGVALAASTRATTGALQGVAASFDQRLLLRLPSREDHLLAGGELAEFRADRRPGAVVWRGAEAQLAVPPGRVPSPWAAELPVVQLGSGAWAVVAARPREVQQRLQAAGILAGELGSGAGVIVADVDGWLADFTALTAARRHERMVFLGCASGDHRTLTRQRTALPPLSSPEEAWVFDGSDTVRARVSFAAPDALYVASPTRESVDKSAESR